MTKGLPPIIKLQAATTFAGALFPETLEGLEAYENLLRIINILCFRKGKDEAIPEVIRKVRDCISSDGPMPVWMEQGHLWPEQRNLTRLPERREKLRG